MSTLGTTTGPGTKWSGPLISGTKKDADNNGPANTGLAVLSQTATLTQNGANDVSHQFVIPAGSQILDIIEDTTVAWNAGTSAGLTVGLTAGGTDYAISESVETAGRVRPAFTGVQLAAMENVGTNTSVYATVTPVGTAATAGSTTVTLVYIQTVQG
ncbi:MAG TPA: hypothetical protein PKX13_12000 [Acidiphilium sp.]|nr:MAG: hypothetical protein B7Z68_00725 [Acidobacteria bacterium 21-70-11]HQU24991.1 hypothetical protein [Acidiphilium sp.]